MKLTSEQIDKILEGAPDGATHIGVYDQDYFEYWRVSSIADDEEYQCFDRGAWTDQEYWYGQHLLSDLREILELRREVERLKGLMDEIGRDSWVAALEADARLRGNPNREDELTIARSMHLTEIQKQLREQCDE